MNNIVQTESGVTMLNNDNYKQCGQHNIQSYFQQYCNKLMNFNKMNFNCIAKIVLVQVKLVCLACLASGAYQRFLLTIAILLLVQEEVKEHVEKAKSDEMVNEVVRLNRGAGGKRLPFFYRNCTSKHMCY